MYKLQYIIGLLFLALLGVCVGCGPKKQGNAEPKAPPKRPNIIYIMSDDHAQKAISAYGDTLIKTPHIDRIAREGVRFDNSFVNNSICAPSRATMLTGKMSHLNGKRDNLDVFDGNQPTFPKLLQKAGYQTAVIGKWHLKSAPQGFDYWKVLIGQGEYYAPEFVSAGDTAAIEGYVTDVITGLALDYLDNRDKDAPFCLLYHHKAPHRNWMPNTKDLALYAGRDLPVPESFHDTYDYRQAAQAAEMKIEDMYLSFDMKLMPGDYDTENGKGGNDQFNAERAWAKSYSRMPKTDREAWDAHYGPINAAFKRAKLSGKALAEWKYQRYMKDYLRCIKSVDDNVGRLLDYLDRNGLAENTIVVYTSDQGFYLGEHGWYDKRFIYDESMRTPLLMRYPKAVKAGHSLGQLVQNIDYAPTFLDFAGVEVPDDMQGRSLRPLLEGKQPQSTWRDALYYHYYEYPEGWHKVKRHYGVRTYRYKLAHFYNDIDTGELYDLQNDPKELKNLYGQNAYAEVQVQMHEKLRMLQKKYQDYPPLEK